MLKLHRTGDWGRGDVDVQWVRSGRTPRAEVEALDRNALGGGDGQARDAFVRRADVPDGAVGGVTRRHAAGTGGCRTRATRCSGGPTSPTRLAGRHGPSVMANPVGVSPAAETADGYLLLGRRSRSVAYYPNRVHPFAGALEPDDGGDLFAAVRRELDELSLRGDEVAEVRCTGIVEDENLRQPELIFRAPFNPDAAKSSGGSTRWSTTTRTGSWQRRATWSTQSLTRCSPPWRSRRCCFGGGGGSGCVVRLDVGETGKGGVYALSIRHYVPPNVHCPRPPVRHRPRRRCGAGSSSTSTGRSSALPDPRRRQGGGRYGGRPR